MPTLLPRRLGARLMAGGMLQVLLISAAMSALAYWSGRRSGLERAALVQQQGRITLLSSQLSSRLDAPRRINQLNMSLIRQGLLRLDNFDALAGRFASQLQAYPVGYINYATTAGDFIGVERRDNGTLTINEDSAHPLGRGRMGIYAVEANGRRGRLLEVIPGMATMNQEAWYADTVKANRPLWSSIYAWEERPEVFSISYNEPVRDSGGQLLGVIGVDFVLTQLSSWLEQLWRDQQGLALVVEHNGMLVAASQPGLTRTGTPGQWRRARINQLQAPLAQLLSSTYFRTDYKGNLQLQTLPATQRRGAVERNDVLLDAQRWGQAQGLNWVLLTATGRDAAMRTSQQLTLVGLLASVIAIGVGLLISGAFSRWLLQPLQELRRRALQAAKEVEANPGQIQFSPQLARDSALEFDQLARAFGELVERLNHQSATLLRQEERLATKLRSSLHAAAVAHEINLPLSTLLLNSRLLLDQNPDQLQGVQRERLEALVAEAQRMVTTIDKMRTLLRNVQTDHHTVDLAGVTRSALLQTRLTLRQAGVVVTRDPSLETPRPVQGDPTQIQIAIVNLLRNAIEALQQRPPVGAMPQIAVSLAQGEAGVDLIVDDNGPGFPADQRTIIPLETTKPEGSGLGLFVVETTMANHRGQLLIGRSPWGGARVRLRFPTGEPLPPQSLPISR
ncbi:MAG: ATP-binding protein [Cyanobacteriota bacterium]|nr:ATP-binding protein [Cyanobacteriota bacterium]